MLGKFWESIGTKLGEKWLAVALPALLFWALGAAAYAHAHGTAGLVDRAKSLQTQPVVLQVLALVAGLLIIAVSAQLVNWVSQPVLRGLQGYWWPPLRSVRRYLTDRQTRRLHPLQDRFDELAPLIANGTADSEQEWEYQRADLELRRCPPRAALHMPTRLGMYLRAAESEAKDKYGLDAVKCWPHLWALLPDQSRADLLAAHAALQRSVTYVIWVVLGMVWAWWVPWLPPIALVLAWLLHRFSLIPNAAAYGDLFRATMDLHRRALYTAVSWPLPLNPAAERAAGEELTEYLWRGSDRADVTFEA
ncbi:hypothetical protein ACFS5L_02150 [Streptomyces phyllanthi]|uniref:Uncharacterized protein n=1 Tax=Streptomyces phyllanthi TaxID=1803180 RepID=A0A5N8VXW2_9ACTN|nr:hypothetical protein [Streptomyces phyllanthi]MPY39769.1 hypothetical protein [Streptomyces phyllanthi]